MTPTLYMEVLAVDVKLLLVRHMRWIIVVFIAHCSQYPEPLLSCPYDLI